MNPIVRISILLFFIVGFHLFVNVRSESPTPSPTTVVGPPRDEDEDDTSVSLTNVTVNGTFLSGTNESFLHPDNDTYITYHEYPAYPAPDPYPAPYPAPDPYPGLNPGQTAKEPRATRSIRAGYENEALDEKDAAMGRLKELMKAFDHGKMSKSKTELNDDFENEKSADDDESGHSEKKSKREHDKDDDNDEDDDHEGVDKDDDDDDDDEKLEAMERLQKFLHRDHVYILSPSGRADDDDDDADGSESTPTEDDAVDGSAPPTDPSNVKRREEAPAKTGHDTKDNIETSQISSNASKTAEVNENTLNVSSIISKPNSDQISLNLSLSLSIAAGKDESINATSLSSNDSTTIFHNRTVYFTAHADPNGLCPAHPKHSFQRLVNLIEAVVGFFQLPPDWRIAATPQGDVLVAGGFPGVTPRDAKDVADTVVDERDVDGNAVSNLAFFNPHLRRRRSLSHRRHAKHRDLNKDHPSRRDRRPDERPLQMDNEAFIDGVPHSAADEKRDWKINMEDDARSATPHPFIRDVTVGKNARKTVEPYIYDVDFTAQKKSDWSILDDTARSVTPHPAEEAYLANAAHNTNREQAQGQYSNVLDIPDSSPNTKRDWIVNEVAQTVTPHPSHFIESGGDKTNYERKESRRSDNADLYGASNDAQDVPSVARASIGDKLKGLESKLSSSWNFLWKTVKDKAKSLKRRIENAG